MKELCVDNIFGSLDVEEKAKKKYKCTSETVGRSPANMMQKNAHKSMRKIKVSRTTNFKKIGERGRNNLARFAVRRQLGQ
jgi:hypothetical protein